MRGINSLKLKSFKKLRRYFYTLNRFHAQIQILKQATKFYSINQVNCRCTIPNPNIA